MAMLDLKKTINKILSKLAYYERQKEVLTGSTNVYSSATGFYTTGKLLTLKPNKNYLLLGRGWSNSGNAFQYMSEFVIDSGSGTQKRWVKMTVQPYASSGGGHEFVAFAETGDSELGVAVHMYKYTTGLTYYWEVFAIEL